MPALMVSVQGLREWIIALHASHATPCTDAHSWRWAGAAMYSQVPRCQGLGQAVTKFWHTGAPSL